MSKKPNLLDILGKVFDDVIVKPAKDILDQNKPNQKETPKKSLIPKNEAVVFWDYENFPLPKEILPEFFFETLFPSSNTTKFSPKRVYSKREIIAHKLDVLENFNFEYRQGPVTGKPNEVDSHLMLECLEYCSKAENSLVVFLISGDIDYLPLISKITAQGHEVRIICMDKKKIKPQLHRSVPIIIDKNQIISSAKELEINLRKISSLINYMIFSKPDHQLSIQELREEFKNQIVNDRVKNLYSRLNLMLKLPEFQEKFVVVDNIFTINSEVYKNRSSENQENIIKFLISDLSSEPDISQWEAKWIQFIQFIPNLSGQEKYIKQMYSIASVPIIRGRLQSKLVEITNMLPVPEKEKLSIKELFCKDCGKLLNSLKSLENHREIAHKVVLTKWICKNCDKEFKTQESLNQHTRMAHKQENIYKCDQCKKKFDNDHALQQHQRIKHKMKLGTNKDISCPKCNRKFVSNEAQKQHIKTAKNH